MTGIDDVLFDKATDVFKAWDKYIRHTRTTSGKYKGYAGIENLLSGEVAYYAESVALFLDKIVCKYETELRKRITTRKENV